VQDDAFDRVEFSLPRRQLQRFHGGLVAGLPARRDSSWGEIDVLGVILIFYPRREQTNDVHLRHAAIAGEIAHRLAVSQLRRNLLNQLADDVTQPGVCCWRAIWLAMRLEY